MADANPELTEHNRRVVAWKDAQDFSGIRADKAAALRNAMLHVGFSADKSGVCTRTIRWLAASSATRGHGVRPVTRGRLWDHITTLEKLGLLSVSRVKNGFTDKSRGLGAVNSYTCEFSQVRVRSGDRSGDRSGVVSTFTRGTREDQKIDSPSAQAEPEAEPTPAGRGRVPFSYPAFRPSAATEKNPSVDARLTGSAELDSIDATFSDPVERVMASELVKVLRDYDYEKVVKAAGFWFTENRYALVRGIDSPRAYARKSADSVRETLDGWQQQEEHYRRCRESKAAESRLEAAAAERRTRETAEQEARGMVRITALTAADWDAPGWLPRDQADQVPGPSGGLVWRPRKRRPDEIDWAAIRAGIDLGEDSPVQADTDSGALPGTMEPGPGINIDELLGEGSEDEPDTGRR